MSDSATTYPAVSPATGEVSGFRLLMMRLIFGGTFLAVGTWAWKAIVTHRGPWDPLHGVAWSFWAAYATLMLLGVRHPLRFLPLLFLQIFYKAVWLVAVAYPLWSAGRLADVWITTVPGTQVAVVFLIAIAVDLAVIPWRYALRTYLLKN